MKSDGNINEAVRAMQIDLFLYHISNWKVLAKKNKKANGFESFRDTDVFSLFIHYNLRKMVLHNYL